MIIPLLHYQTQHKILIYFFLNIINTSLFHQLVVLDVLTLNPSSGVSLKSDGYRWIYETLKLESLYSLSLRNGLIGTEVHNLKTIFTNSNQINNLSQNYIDFLDSEEKKEPSIANLSSLNIYSLSETEIGTWIDGKIIYRIVFKTLGPSVANTEFIVPESVYLKDLVSDVISLYGTYYFATSNNVFCLDPPLVDGLSTFRWTHGVGLVLYITNKGFLNAEATIVFEFTKK